ncbi:5783_t:CDS:2, partial [Acaulospora morrowiae]
MANTPASFSYLSEFGTPISPNSSEPNYILDEEVKLYANNKEREKYENLADVYAIIITMEYLEKAYVRDSVSAAELTQYKTAMNLVSDLIPDLDKFMKDYK